jgi:hypothetical protein
LRRPGRVVVRNTAFQGGIHVDAICDYLQAVTEGKIKRLIINIPPREGKSTLVSVLWPSATLSSTSSVAQAAR